jgi:AcrR family transcriptional regulator
MALTTSFARSRPPEGQAEPPEPQVHRLEENAEQNRREILAAAALAFMEQGYAATSIDTVAIRLGATKGRIYYHYRSKADLFFEVHREAMLMNLEVIRPVAVSDASAPERLRRMALAHAHLVMDHLPFQRVSVQGVEMHLTGSTTPAQRSTLQSLIAMRDEYEGHFIDVLEAGIRSGEFRQLSARMVVKPLLGALNWLTMWYRPALGETGDMKEQIAEQHAAFVLGGVMRR